MRVIVDYLLCKTDFYQESRGCKSMMDCGLDPQCVERRPEVAGLLRARWYALDSYNVKQAGSIPAPDLKNLNSHYLYESKIV